MSGNSSHWHIGLNAHLLSGRAGYRSAGIHQYIQNLLQNLPAVGEGMRFTALVGPRAPAPPMPAIFSRLPTDRPPVRILWEQLALPWLAARAGFDLLHSAAFVLPLAHPGPQVVTVYDLSFELNPERFRFGQRRYLSLFTRLSCRRARRVLVISENTRADVTRRYGIPGDRVDVAYPGIGPQFTPHSLTAVAEFRLQHALPEKFVLSLGTIEPRKNLDKLIRAFARLQLPDVKLVLAGGRGWMYEEIFRLIEYLQLNNAVIFPGFVADKDLPLWYSAASAFAYPSAYEGFGLPPAEAMACGAPVVVSDAASLPEVVGEAALRVPADDADALAEALHQILTDPALRDSLRERGPRQARRFTWEATARATTACYRRALGADQNPP
ncbi:MAG: glycosyltransferase family 4 protein [Chloroflexi bacterium]|nr:glycosyltransferase family 4 protein [Chloroflexota bacterium]